MNPDSNSEKEDEISNRLRPPGAKWLVVLILIAISVFVIQAFGLKGHLALLKAKAQWETMSAERNEMIARASALRMECASNEVIAADLQTNLVTIAAELSARKAEVVTATKLLRQSQIDREIAEADLRRAVAATNELWTMVLTLSSQTNGLRITATPLEDQCMRLRQDKIALDAQITAQTTAQVENRKDLETLATRTRSAQGEWQRVSRELEDASQRLANADASRSNAIARTAEMEKQLAYTTTLVVSNTQQAATMQHRVTQLDGERTKTQLQLDEVGRQLTVLRDEMKKVEQILTTAKGELAKTQADVTTLTKQRDEILATLTKQRDELQHNLDQARGELVATEKNLSEKRTENANLETRNIELAKRLRADVSAHQGAATNAVPTK